MSSNSLANVTKNLIHRMISLNVGADLGSEVHVVLLHPLFLLVLVLPLDPCYYFEVLVPHLELEVAPSLRKKVDLALVVPMVAHRLSP
jgi:hypothetical protein